MTEKSKPHHGKTKPHHEKIETPSQKNRNPITVSLQRHYGKYLKQNKNRAVPPTTAKAGGGRAIRSYALLRQYPVSTTHIRFYPSQIFLPKSAEWGLLGTSK